MNTTAILDEHANAIGDRGADGGGPALRRARRWPASADAVRPRPERARVRQRTIGRVAGVLFSLAALYSLATIQMVTHVSPSFAFTVVVGVALASGITFAVLPWERLPRAWLHAIPAIATVEVTLAVWAAGVHGGIYATY